MLKNRIKNFFNLFVIFNLNINSENSNMINNIITTNNYISKIRDQNISTKFGFKFDMNEGKISHNASIFEINTNNEIKISTSIITIKFKIYPFYLFYSNNKTIFDDIYMNRKGNKIPVNSYLLLNDYIKNEDYLDTYLSNDYEKSTIGSVSNVVRFSVQSIHENNSFIEFSNDNYKKINIFQAIRNLKYSSTLSLEEGYFSTNGLCIGVGKYFLSKNVKNQGICGVKLFIDLNKLNTILDHVLLIESMKFIPYFGIETKYFKIFISPVIYYKYEIDKLIKQYKGKSLLESKNNDSKPPLYDVELSTKDNGAFNFEIPVSLKFFDVLCIEFLYNVNTQQLTHIVDIQILDSLIHKISISGTLSDISISKNIDNNKKEFDFNTYIENFKALTSLKLNIKYTYNVGGHKITVKISDILIKNILDGKITLNPFSSKNFDVNKVKFIYPFLILISYGFDSSKNTNTSHLNKRNDDILSPNLSQLTF